MPRMLRKLIPKAHVVGEIKPVATRMTTLPASPKVWRKERLATIKETQLVRISAGEESAAVNTGDTNQSKVPTPLRKRIKPPKKYLRFWALRCAARRAVNLFAKPGAGAAILTCFRARFASASAEQVGQSGRWFRRARFSSGVSCSSLSSFFSKCW